MLDTAASRTAELAAPGLDPRPRRRVAVLACMDTRIDLFPMLGLERGDAHIIRNAGGLVTEDELEARIREAAGRVDLERLAVGTQCGFSTSVVGNALTVEDERRKLAVISATAARIWG